MSASLTDTAVKLIAVTEEPLDTAGLTRMVREPSAGAVVLFEGITRDIPSLSYEVYEPMAVSRLTAHAHQAVEQFGLSAVAIMHRSGDVALSEPSVGIAVSAPHRPEAFAAGKWLIDAIKRDVPIWKRENAETGSTWGKSEWPSTSLSVAILTVSDSRSAGTNEDRVTPQLAAMLTAAQHTVVRTALVPDDAAAIATAIEQIVDGDTPDLLITSGGTGIGPRDVTPEATSGVVDRLVPGISEMLRSRSAQIHPNSWLSRGIAGTRASTLVVNVPGSPAGAVECTEWVLPLATHAVAMLRGDSHDGHHTGAHT